MQRSLGPMRPSWARRLFATGDAVGSLKTSTEQLLVLWLRYTDLTECRLQWLTQTRSYRNVLTNRNGGERGVAYFCSGKLFASMLQCETNKSLVCECACMHECTHMRFGMCLCGLECASLVCTGCVWMLACVHVCMSNICVSVPMNTFVCVHELLERVPHPTDTPYK